MHFGRKSDSCSSSSSEDRRKREKKETKEKKEEKEKREKEIKEKKDLRKKEEREMKEKRQRDRVTNKEEAQRTQQQTRKRNNRFSLRRFFLDSPLLAHPFYHSPASPAHTPASTHSTRTTRFRRGGGPPKSGVDESNWRDNVSSCSSQGQAGTSIAPDGKVIRECPLCLSTQTIDHFPLLRNCHHLFCLDCLQFYVKIELQEGRGNVRCPQCVELMHPNDIEMFIGDKNSNLLKLYEFLMLRRLLATDPDTRWCPGPNCTYAVIATGCASCPKIQCERPGCGFAFCYHCKAEWHPNQTCDMARAKRMPIRGSSVSFSQESGNHSSEVKVCPRCNVLIVKMDDGSCNHMTCSVCGSEFCWLCMKEISDLHYLSPSGCTFWGKKPWSRKKKLLWQLGTLVGAPVGIALLAGIAVPAMIIGIPVWVGRKLHAQYTQANKHKRNVIITGGVVASVVVAPLLAGLAISIGVPILLAYVYGVVPISLCRSEGCGVSTSASGVRIDVDEEEMPYRPIVLGDTLSAHHVANPSIGEVSLGASMSLGSACHLDERDNNGAECDRESASNTAIAGTSRTVSLAGSYHPSGAFSTALISSLNNPTPTPTLASSYSNNPYPNHPSLMNISSNPQPNQTRLEVDVHTRGLRANMADSQSVGSYKMTSVDEIRLASGDEISLRSLPVNSVIQRSLSPVSNLSGEESNLVSVRRSIRKRPNLDKQLSENSSLLSAEDTCSERVRFDDNVSFIDERGEESDGTNPVNVETVSFPKIHKPSKLETCRVPEETAEELALVISPEPKRSCSVVREENHITLVNIGGEEKKTSQVHMV